MQLGGCSSCGHASVERACVCTLTALLRLAVAVQAMPYDHALVAVAKKCPVLKRINLKGIKNYGGFKYCLTHRAVDAVQRTGTAVELGRQEHW